MHTKDHKEIIWNKYFIIATVINFLTNMAHYTLLITIPLYVNELGSSNEMTGILTALYSIAALLTRPFWGNITDTKGKRLVTLLGAILFTVVSSLYHVAFSVIFLLLLRVINGIAFSALSTASGAVAADVLPKSKLSEGMGFYFLGLAVATAIGPSIGLYLIENYGFSMLFTFLLIVNGIEIIAVFALNYEKKINGIHKMKEQKEHQFSIDNYFERTALKPAIVMLLVALGSGSVMSFITVFGASRGIEKVGLFFTVYACAVIFSRFVIGRLIDKFGVGKTLVPSMLLCAISFLMLSVTYSLPMLILVGVFYGLGYGVITPIISVIMFEKSPENKKGAASGTLYAALDIGIGLGALFWGFVSVKIGFTAVYILSAVCVFCGIAAYMILLHKKEKK